MPAVESRAIATQDDSDRTMRDNDFAKTAGARAYQSKLPQRAQAQMQLAFEFAQTLTQLKSPFQFPSVLSELTYSQFVIFQKLSGQSSR
jgi:hypothetical protein